MTLFSHEYLYINYANPNNSLMFQVTPDGRYILARDFLHLKIWDVNMESRPVATIPVILYIYMYIYM